MAELDTHVVYVAKCTRMSSVLVATLTLYVSGWKRSKHIAVSPPVTAVFQVVIHSSIT